MKRHPEERFSASEKNSKVSSHATEQNTLQSLLVRDKSLVLKILLEDLNRDHANNPGRFHSLENSRLRSTPNLALSRVQVHGPKLFSPRNPSEILWFGILQPQLVVHGYLFVGHWNPFVHSCFGGDLPVSRMLITIACTFPNRAKKFGLVVCNTALNRSGLTISKTYTRMLAKPNPCESASDSKTERLSQVWQTWSWQSSTSNVVEFLGQRCQLSPPWFLRPDELSLDNGDV